MVANGHARWFERTGGAELLVVDRGLPPMRDQNQKEPT
jgi:hypothetical protein